MAFIDHCLFTIDHKPLLKRLRAGLNYCVVDNFEDT